MFLNNNVINGRWQKAEILPYKHAIVAYGAAIAGFPSQTSFGGWVAKKPPHHLAMVPPFDNIAQQQ